MRWQEVFRWAPLCYEDLRIEVGHNCSYLALLSNPLGWSIKWDMWTRLAHTSTQTFKEFCRHTEWFLKFHQKWIYLSSNSLSCFFQCDMTCMLQYLADQSQCKVKSRQDIFELCNEYSELFGRYKFATRISELRDHCSKFAIWYTSWKQESILANFFLRNQINFSIFYAKFDHFMFCRIDSRSKNDY